MSVFRKSIGLISLVLSLPVMAVPAPDAGAFGELKSGKWVGYLQLDNAPDAIALTMDSYAIQPEDPNLYPTRNLIFKMSLGGYLSPEYETEHFENVQYDFNGGHVSLDEPRNEMVINAIVRSTPKFTMEGRVYLRSSAVSGKIFLALQSDEPGGGGIPKTPPLMPTLAGQYEGSCGKEQTVLQIETGKGLTEETPVPTAGLHHYNITGTLGVVNGVCPSVNGSARPSWCVDHAFSSGTYDYFTGRLFLSGTLETDQCQRKGDEFVCKMRLLPKGVDEPGLIKETCHFKKVANKPAPFQISSRRFHVKTTPEQRQELPLSTPPQSLPLTTALGGSFYGYLHHEYTDRYQPLRLDVNPTVSSNTPHNDNDVFVSVTSILSFGRSFIPDVWAQQFDRRVLYVVPAYTLKSDQSDTFLHITQWKKGYISGIWYSRTFGEVGTFEVVKGIELPPLPATAKVVEPISGEFRGAEERSNGGKDYWDVTLLVPKQPRSVDQSYLLFMGNFQLNAGGVSWPTQKIARGAYDIFTGAVAWKSDDGVTSESKLVSGFVNDVNSLRLFWPGERTWAVGVFDHELGTYRRTED